MNTTDLLNTFREEVMDTEAPYLWSDPLIYTYIDEAQKQFCRWTDGIEDSRTFRISIRADGTEWYEFDPMILKIRGARRIDTGRPIPVIAIEKMESQGLRFDGSVGPIRALISGMEKNALRALPKPNEAVVLELDTFRLPETVGPETSLVIDAQHHLFLLDWVKYRAYNKQDAETFNPKAAEKHLMMFKGYCAEAKAEQGRLRRPVSTVAYGGI